MTPAEWHRWCRHVLKLATKELRPAQKLVLLSLAEFADYPTGLNARPGIAQLADACALDERTVRYALKAGRELNLIEQIARANPKRGFAAVYRLVPQHISTGPLDPVDAIYVGPLDPVENSSIGLLDPVERNFNRIGSTLLPDQNRISTGSLDPPTDSSPTHRHRLSELRKSGTSPSGEPAWDPANLAEPQPQAETPGAQLTARSESQSSAPPAFVRGLHGPRCRRHGHLKAPPGDCNGCREVIAAEGER